MLSECYCQIHAIHFLPASPQTFLVVRCTSSYEQHNQVYHSNGIHGMTLTLPGEKTAIPG
jgi:pyruvate/2-oxoglutarate/acetoin dehydrogenase E1 component